MKIPGWKRVVVCLLGTALLVGASGCAFSRGDLGVPLAETDVSEIKKGQTTEAQVVALLGAPQSVQQIDDQEVFHYYHYALKHGTFLVFSRVNVASDDLYVFFNATKSRSKWYWASGRTSSSSSFGHLAIARESRCWRFAAIAR